MFKYYWSNFFGVAMIVALAFLVGGILHGVLPGVSLSWICITLGAVVILVIVPALFSHEEVGQQRLKDECTRLDNTRSRLEDEVRDLKEFVRLVVRTEHVQAALGKLYKGYEDKVVAYRHTLADTAAACLPGIGVSRADSVRTQNMNLKLTAMGHEVAQALRAIDSASDLAAKVGYAIPDKDAGDGHLHET